MAGMVIPSRAAQFSARLIEVGWLTALLAIPVFFNVWSDRVFEPDKLSLLRSIALVMATAGLVWRIERGRPEPGALRRWLSVPIVAPVLLVSAVYVFASLLSVDPRASWLGGHNRLQGTYTWAAYLVVFLAVVTLLRDRLQLDRLLFALVLPSLPVGLYGLLQKLSSPDRKLDPMPWLGDTSKRVASTMGNSIFVSAYLILTVPITLVLLARAMRDLDEDESNTAVLRVSAYLVMLAMQMITIVLSQSRGPWLGLLGGIFLLALLLAAWRGRRVMLAMLGAGAAVAAFLVVFNLPNSPLAPLRSVPYLGRLGQVFEVERGTGRVRVLIWTGAAELVTSDPVRLLVGWGPESMQVAYNRFYQPELANLESRNASPDRSHNETFDTLVNSGLIGFLAYLFLFTSIFYHGLKWLGFIGEPGHRNTFLALWLGGGALAAAAFQLWSGDLAYFGVSLPLGMIVGLFTFVVLRTLRGFTPPDRPGTLLVAGLLAAIIAHFIEINLGIAIAATRTVFFALTGAMVVVGALSAERPGLLGPDAEPVAAASPAPGKRRAAARRPDPHRGRKRWGWLSDALMMLTLLATMVYTFVVSLNLQAVQAAAMLWLFAFTWGLGSLAVVAEAAVRSRQDPSAPRPALWPYVGLTLGGLLLYLLLHAGALVTALQPSSATAYSGADASSLLLMLHGCVTLGLAVAWAVVLLRDDPASGLAFRARGWWLYPVAAVLALALAVISNVNVVRADIYYKQAYVNYHGHALDLQDQGKTDEADPYFQYALQNYDRALGLNPGDDYYMLFRGKALLERADAKSQALVSRLDAARGDSEAFSEYNVQDEALATGVAERDAAFEQALTALRAAREAAPLNTDHVANLGRAYKFWADRTLDQARREERFEASREFYRQAILQSPNNAGLMEELATTEYLAGDVAAAREGISRTLAVDPNFGRPYRLLATIQREAGDCAGAVENYQRFVASREGARDALAWSGLAVCLGRLRRFDEAIEANQKVLEIAPGDVSTLRNLVILNRDAGDSAAACGWVAQLAAAQPEDPETAALGNELGCASGASSGGPAPGLETGASAPITGTGATP
jgi:tetratricopeptide (TPR) repeat protein/O-antigen ligase